MNTQKMTQVMTIIAGIKTYKNLITVGLTTVSFLAINSIKTNAAILMTITDNGTDLLMTATGSYDLSAITPLYILSILYIRMLS